MDSVDLKLLKILYSNARTSLKEMAREVGLSTSGVRRRIQQLEKTKLIRQYSAVIDPKKYGYGVMAFIKIEADPRGIKDLVRALMRKHEVCELHRISGGDSIIAKVRSKDVDGLNRFIESNITSSEFVRGTSTLISMETYKEEAIINP